MPAARATAEATMRCPGASLPCTSAVRMCSYASSSSVRCLRGAWKMLTASTVARGAPAAAGVAPFRVALGARSSGVFRRILHALYTINARQGQGTATPRLDRTPRGGLAYGPLRSSATDPPEWRPWHEHEALGRRPEPDGRRRGFGHPVLGAGHGRRQGQADARLACRVRVPLA